MVNCKLALMGKTTDPQVIIRNAYEGKEKDDRGNKTNEPLIDGKTGMPVWWLSAVMFPKGSMGGDDISMIIKCLHKGRPIDVPYGESVLVELVDPTIEVGSNGRLSLCCSDVKSVKGDK